MVDKKVNAKYNSMGLMLAFLLGLGGCVVDLSEDSNDRQLVKSVDRAQNVQSAGGHASSFGDAFISRTSSVSFERTLSGVKSAINKRGFKTFSVIDHAAGAASIDTNLRPTTLIIFGNPAGGTPLMQSSQLMGLALPLKMMVYTDDQGKTKIAWPDMDQEFRDHGVFDRESNLSKIKGALNAIANEAASGN